MIVTVRDVARIAIWPLLCVAFVAMLDIPAVGDAGPDSQTVKASALERRAALIRRAGDGPQAIPRLTQALDDQNLVVRRTAVRLLAEMGAPAKAALIGVLDNDDIVVRRTALRAICALLRADALPFLAKAVEDDHMLVRQAAVEQLVNVEPRTDEVIELLKAAQGDKADSVRAVASEALWPFRRERVSIRNRKDWDHDVRVVQTIPLPKDGWRFNLDPRRDGHLKQWFEPAFDDSEWDVVSIEQAWQKAGYDHVGVAWYRRWIEVPEEPEHAAIEVHFKGVDECAWVWLNGTYVGEHDIGPEGWNQSFLLDITREVQWGEKNQITVRAMNTAHAGGIWRPVQIEVLQ